MKLIFTLIIWAILIMGGLTFIKGAAMNKTEAERLADDEEQLRWLKERRNKRK